MISDSFQLNPVLNWRNTEKYTSVAGYKCRLFSVNNFNYKLATRIAKCDCFYL